MFAFVAQLTIGIVFDDRDAKAFGQGDHFRGAAVWRVTPIGFWKVGMSK